MGFPALDVPIFRRRGSPMKLAACLLFSLAVFPITEPACQSITNNDFEGGTLTGWTYYSTDPVDGWRIATGISEPYGLFSATCQKLSIGGASHSIYQEVDVNTGSTYRATAWIEQNLSAGSAYFGFFVSPGSPLAVVAVPNTPFVEVSVEWTALIPSGPPSLGYYWQNANGTAYFDTVNVVLVSPEATPTATPTVTPTWTPYQPVTAVDGNWEIYR